MSLNTPQLKTDLGELYDDTLTGEGNAADARASFVNRLSEVIEAYVKTATVVYTSGLTAGANTVVGTFNGHVE